MQREASSLSAMADGSHDLFLMRHTCANSLEGPPGLKNSGTAGSEEICPGVVVSLKTMGQ